MQLQIALLGLLRLKQAVALGKFIWGGPASSGLQRPRVTAVLSLVATIAHLNKQTSNTVDTIGT